jgi:histidinol-phosphate aminotransferase
MKEAVKRPQIEVSEAIRTLVPYSPGKPIEELEREMGIKAIKLASNENPLGPSKKAVEAIKGALAGIHRYPDGSCFYLKKKLAAFLGFEEKNIVVGNGSNEIIELLIRTFLGEGGEAIMGDPSFAVYPLIVQAAGGRAVKTPLKGLTIDLTAIEAKITERTRLIFISNPNNPTGTIVKKGEFDRFLDRVPDSVVVCMDEAYSEYATSAEFPDSLRYAREGRAVVTLRTFSKIYGLAGIRVGYGAAREDIVDYLNRVRQPFNVNALAQVAATAALDDAEHVQRSKKNNSEGLTFLFGELGRLGLECVPTEANFFLLKTGDGESIYRALLEKGVIVRPMGSYGMNEYIRITVGTPQENRIFVKALKEALFEKKS